MESPSRDSTAAAANVPVKTYTRFHAGEVQVQAEAGTDTDEYESFSRQMMIPDLKPAEAAFVEGLTFSFAGSVDHRGRPWASPLVTTGAQLFTVNAPTLVAINAAEVAGDPLRRNIEDSGELSVLYFDPATRRRSKSIGQASLLEDGGISYTMTRNFGLCPKYIYKRSHEPAPSAEFRSRATTHTQLQEADIDQLRATDTVFFASHSPHGADVTHRGGSPGFVNVLHSNQLEVPDFFGNGMFNTFGNLVLDDRLGISSTNFDTGRTVHMTGRAQVERTNLPEPAPQRRVLFEIEDVIVSYAPIGRWTDHEPSRYSPPAFGAVTG